MSVEKQYDEIWDMQGNHFNYYCNPTIKWDIDDYYIHTSMEIHAPADDIGEQEVSEILTLWKQLNEMS